MLTMLCHWMYVGASRPHGWTCQCGCYCKESLFGRSIYGADVILGKNSCVPVMHVNELAKQGYRTLKGVAADAGKAYLMLCRCSHPCHMESLNVGDSL
jgi:hypothetical protein